MKYFTSAFGFYWYLLKGNINGPIKVYCHMNFALFILLGETAERIALNRDYTLSKQFRRRKQTVQRVCLLVRWPCFHVCIYQTKEFACSFGHTRRVVLISSLGPDKIQTKQYGPKLNFKGIQNKLSLEKYVFVGISIRVISSKLYVSDKREKC